LHGARPGWPPTGDRPRSGAAAGRDAGAPGPRPEIHSPMPLWASLTEIRPDRDAARGPGCPARPRESSSQPSWERVDEGITAPAGSAPGQGRWGVAWRGRRRGEARRRRGGRGVAGAGARRGRRGGLRFLRLNGSWTRYWSERFAALACVREGVRSCSGDQPATRGRRASPYRDVGPVQGRDPSGLRLVRRLRLARAVEGDRLANERPEGGLVDFFSFVDVDRAACVSVETRVEETGRIL
jgi:hypothetical protein